MISEEVNQLEAPTKSCDWNRALPLVIYILWIFSDKQFQRLPAVGAQDIPDVCSVFFFFATTPNKEGKTIEEVHYRIYDYYVNAPYLKGTRAF